ncbi:MAG: hypothetical protein LBD24_08475 [Spirochaetaceae bacterium]|jgi:hypothetical protein|nr:hypothetical protein [Spirochaetaceae bacterium]
MRKVCVLVLVLAGAAIIAGCAASNPYAKIDEAAYRAEYGESMTLLEKDKKKLYRDRLLYCLDKGMLAHYAEGYEDSIGLLQEGEQAIEDAFTKSVTEAIGSSIVNDKVRAYAGEDYENIYVNAFNALSYYHRGDLESALVEIRRMTEKLDFLAVAYGETITDLQAEALEKTGTPPPDPDSSPRFSNSALARYLGMLFYRADGYEDDARIDRDQIKIAFANAPEVYNFPLPSSIDEELDIPAGYARLNVIGFSGLSPVKEEEVLRIPIPGPRYIKIALPVMVNRPSEVARVEVVFESGLSFTLQLLEDLEAVARKTFKEKVAMIYLKSVIRATAKGAVSSTLGAVAEEVEDGTASLVFGALSLGAQIFAEASEQADLRVSRFFPAKAYVGGITLPPGTYAAQVRYYGYNGSLLGSSNQKRIVIRENTLNLMEAVCLK